MEQGRPAAFSQSLVLLERTAQQWQLPEEGTTFSSIDLGLMLQSKSLFSSSTMR